jgi:putative component of toxin-antitoxin plasmid stabilization module
VVHAALADLRSRRKEINLSEYPALISDPRASAFVHYPSLDSECERRASCKNRRASSRDNLASYTHSVNDGYTAIRELRLASQLDTNLTVFPRFTLVLKIEWGRAFTRRNRISCGSVAWTVEFFEDDQGRQPAREWLVSLDARKKAAMIAAVEAYLGEMGLDVCGTEHGKQLGDGLFELRVRGDGIVLRLFCHAYGERIILLLGGYDKGVRPSARHQQRQIEKARQRLRSFRLQRGREKIGKERRR